MAIETIVLEPAIFEHVCTSLATEPGSVFFTDDSARNVEGATNAGLVAHLFRGADGLKADLDRASVS